MTFIPKLKSNLTPFNVTMLNFTSFLNDVMMTICGLRGSSFFFFMLETTDPPQNKVEKLIIISGVFYKNLADFHAYKKRVILKRSYPCYIASFFFTFFRILIMILPRKCLLLAIVVATCLLVFVSTTSARCKLKKNSNSKKWKSTYERLSKVKK